MSASRRWIVIGVISAVLNVFLIGFLAGRHVVGPAGCGMRKIGRDVHAGFQHRVSEAARAKLREQLEQVRVSREQVRAALRSDPYQPAQLEAALGTLRERSAELQLDMHQQLVETAGHLTVEQRRKLADARFLRPALGPGP